MAVCIINKFSGITAERFRDAFPRLLPNGLPPAVSTYIGGVNKEGLTVIAVFDTAEALDALMVHLPAMLEREGFPMPISTRIEVVRVNTTLHGRCIRASRLQRDRMSRVVASDQVSAVPFHTQCSPRPRSRPT